MSPPGAVDPSVGAALAVVGSANLDIVVGVPRHPRLGETVIGGDHAEVAGGKGANQAVAAARLGAPTSFVGCVGDDAPGQALRRALADDGVEIAALETVAGAPSGVALIVVGEEGENTIVVSPGANARLSPGHVAAAGARIAEAAALLVQLEIPLATVEAAVGAARGLVVCNPAPATALPPSVLERVDVLVPNRSELALLAGADDEPVTTGEVTELARGLPGPAAVGAEVAHLPAMRVAAVDATAAGDAFCAALTVRLLAGD
ncbi:MAG: ribokinase, partial [Egibacteraceae bacterium]